ncbi:MAG: NAD(P)H-hydrate epimerase [Elusimicrobiota bacterium]
MKAPIPAEYDGYPVVTPAQMIEIDRRAIKEFNIPALELMENAGRAVAEEAAKLIEAGGAKLPESSIAVCCGRGNNGGDGLVAARHLKEKGAEAFVFLMPPKRDGKYSEEVQKNLVRANEAGVSVHQVSEELVELDIRLRSSAVILDALLGTGSSGKPAGLVHKMIQRMNKAGVPIIAVDVPSGLHPETGYHSGVVVTAALTCTLGLPKCGLLPAPAKRFVGELKVLDIGFPKELIAGVRA